MNQSPFPKKMFRYAITDRRSRVGLNVSSASDPFAGLVDQAKRLAVEGVDFLQLREKDLDARGLIGLTRRIITAVGEADAAPGPLLRVLVNGRADVALAAGTDGVHLPSGPEQLSVAQVRQVFGAQAIVSVACHTLREVEAASAAGADLILYSPVFGKLLSGGKRLEAAGLRRLTEACRAAGAVPVLALGGVTSENAQSCFEAGARGIAGIRLFQHAEPFAARMPT